jgi:quercetin dioxygenase-like cupin family protein
MAGIVLQESDLRNHRVFSMWEEAGIQFRSNLVTEMGGTIPLHAHSYDHVALCVAGIFRCDVDNESFEVGPGSKTFIGQGKQHTFTLLKNAPGEILCLWPCHKG